MRKFASRRGSALLIVLGMLSFMIVSAVGFAAYMRYARLPSSYLRRTSASRLLAKAAIAEAINAVDRAVYDNPHPGVGNLRLGSGTIYNERQYCNFWVHRVLIGTNVCCAAFDPNTVSPLCLEALAYIPPPLVNEARYYSRVTPTAKWQTMGFDSGRYSFVALDVSDCFDINRMVANMPRSSASNGRISLAYLFEDEDHAGLSGGEKAWDSFMQSFRRFDILNMTTVVDGMYPLISLADFNLALKSNVGEFYSPFRKYIGSSGGDFYVDATDRDKREIVRRMMFVTDGWFPKTNNTVTCDLTDPRFQPFTKDALDRSNPRLSDFLLFTDGGLNASEEMKWTDRLSGLGCAALYDYLDPDHIPISLAIPTTERVPMICGFSSFLQDSEFKITRKYTHEKEAGVPHPNGSGKDAPAMPGQERDVEQIVEYIIDGDAFTRAFQAAQMSALVCFPFSHKDEKDSDFKMDGRLSFFLSEGDVGLRAGNDAAGLWLADRKINNTAALDRNNGVLNVPFVENSEISFKAAKIEKEADALKKPNLTFDASAAGSVKNSFDTEVFLRVKYKWHQKAESDAASAGGALGGTLKWTPIWSDLVAGGKLKDCIEEAHCGWPAIKWNNKSCQGVDQDMMADGALKDFLKGGQDKELTLRAAVWLRVVDNNTVVDMVPACLADDKVHLGVNDTEIETVGTGLLGAPHPLMLFSTGVNFHFSINALDSFVDDAPQRPINVSPSAVIVADPRYNHAPEHWFTLSAGELTAENWLQNNQTGTVDSHNEMRDRDIFMATSDAGYMQSKYEVAFLPALTDLVAGGDVAGWYEAPRQYNAIPGNFNDTCNKDNVWKTYNPYGEDMAAFKRLPWNSEGTGFKVNPYSDSTNVLMAAFANTPLDWKRASTNMASANVSQCAGTYVRNQNVSDFNKKYAWNEYDDDDVLAWDVLEGVAGDFIEYVNWGRWGGPGADQGHIRTWEECWDELWLSCKAESPDQFMGMSLADDGTKLWSADRKFLYGYWRDCFAAKQQLYLVFARAEPMMMGGGGAGRLPPQLSARAMALVWRNPVKSPGSDSFAPHQTRVLFYRQFE